MQQLAESTSEAAFRPGASYLLHVARLLIVALSAGLMAFVPAPARALVVATLPGTDSAPMGAGNDPGWAEVTQAGSNYVYLGDSWVLSARHVGVSTANFSTGSFSPIPTQDFIVSNPTSSGLTDSQGNFTTDLRLIRINGDPGLPSIFGPNPAFTIPTQEPSVDDLVTTIGYGPTRAANTTSWDSNWTEVPPPGSFTGYKPLLDQNNNIVYNKRWGKNNIADKHEVFNDQTAGVTHVVSLKTGDGITRSIVSLATRFDQSAGTYESQAVAGDSGSSVFRKNPTTQQWELAGIVNSTFIYDKQSTSAAAYGDLTSFADLAYYHDQIFNIINAHQNYSVNGDLTLDGVVSGNGTGPAATDDVTAFIQGWSYQQATGDITSWKKGDLNLDGKVDVADFLLLRAAFNGSPGSGASLNSLAALVDAGKGGVPEPSSLLLATIGAAWLAAFYRRRSARSAR
jgi:hypothetical protein